MDYRSGWSDEGSRLGLVVVGQGEVGMVQRDWMKIEARTVMKEGMM